MWPHLVARLVGGNKLYAYNYAYAYAYAFADADDRAYAYAYAGAYEEGYADNDGIKIYYRDYGPKNAEPILLVQGLGGQLTFWPDNLINFLKEDNKFDSMYP